MRVQEIQNQIDKLYDHYLKTTVVQFVKPICYPIQNHQHLVK